MLQELVEQTRSLSGELDRRPELILLYEKTAVPEDVVTTAVRSACGTDSPFDVRLQPTEGSSYYMQKNQGAELATRDYVLFIDSDVVPEPGWLAALLGTLRDGASVVCGSTYVDPETFAGRAFGLFWFFKPRSEVGGLRPCRRFFVNNVFFRRDLFLAVRFPDLPFYRGQCTALAARLDNQGIEMFEQRDARVAHPPPEAREFRRRALAEGYDLFMRRHVAGQAVPLTPAELERQLELVHRRMNERRPHFDIDDAEFAAAASLATSYARVRFVGQRWAAHSPEHARRTLGIQSPARPVELGRWLRMPLPSAPTRTIAQLA